MLSNEMLSLIAIGGTTIGVIGAMLGALPYLNKKGVNTDKLLDTADTALNAAQPLIGIAEGLFPGNAAINLVDFIDKQAIKAVKNVQQLNDSSQLTDDERKQTALNSVYASLKEINIEPTDNQKKLMEDAIEAAVYDLPHTPVDVKQLQVTIDQQNTQNVQLQQENTQLKQAISAITVTAQAVQPNIQTVA